MTFGWFQQNYATFGGYLTHFWVDGFRYFVALFGSFFLSLLLTPILREAARKLGMVDTPNERRINKTPIPRGGGLSIILAFHAVLWLLVWFTNRPISASFPLDKQLAFLFASLLLAIVGLLDDAKGLKPILKLLGQISAATILFFSGYHLGCMFHYIPLWLDYGITIFWIVGAINAFNLIDGLDGLSAGLALIAAIGMGGSLLFSGKIPDTIPYLILAGACIGFLRYNFHPASVFLGDTGSMFLGLAISTLPMLTGSQKELMASLGMPFLVMGVPIFDTFLAIWRRTVRHFLPKRLLNTITSKDGVMQPDKDHLHHRLLREAMNSQKAVAIILYSLAFLLVLLGFASILLKGRAPGLFFLAFVTLTVVLVRNFECIELFDTGKLLSGNNIKRRRILFLPLSILIDVVLLTIIWLVTWFMVIDQPLTREFVLTAMPTYVVPAFIAISVAQVYRRVWSRAQIKDYIIMAFSLFMAGMVSIGIMWISRGLLYHMVRFSFLYAALSFLSLSTVRAWHECLFTFLQIFSRKIDMLQPSVKRVLVYGGGLHLRGFLRENYERCIQENHRIIIGILDDDLHLRGRLIAGYKVLGTGKDIERIVEENHIHEIIVTCEMSQEKLCKLVSRLKALHIKASIWSCREKPLLP